MSDPVAQIQRDIAARLESCEYFADIAVIVNERGVSESDILTALKTRQRTSGAVGVAVVVDRPSRRVEFADVPGPMWTVTIPVIACEHPTINRGTGGTGKEIEDIASEIFAAVHHLYLADIGSTIYCATEAVIPSVTEDGLITAECVFEVKVNQAARSHAIGPTITGTPAAVTLTTSTSGAEIWYSTDGTYPSSVATTASKYTSSFAVATGALVRAVAYKSGLMPSSVSAAIIT